MDSPNVKGAVAELAIELAATKLGIPVLKPVAEHGRYDMGFEIGPNILRVQCKWGNLDADAGIIKVNLTAATTRATCYRARSSPTGARSICALQQRGMDSAPALT